MLLELSSAPPSEMVAAWRSMQEEKRRNSTWKKRNPELFKTALRKSHLKRKFNISLEEWDKLYEAQGGKCAINKNHKITKYGLHVDHDHKTGKIRGLLCHHCNCAIGHIRDDTETLREISRYLGGENGRGW